MIWSNLGAAHLGRLELAGPRQQERAIRAYERALTVDPKAPNIHYILGLIYTERREFARATELFQQALAVDPADRDARYWIDWLAQQPATAEELVEDAPTSFAARQGDTEAA